MTLFIRRPGDPVPEEIEADGDKTLGSLGIQVKVDIQYLTATACGVPLQSYH